MECSDETPEAVGEGHLGRESCDRNSILFWEVSWYYGTEWMTLDGGTAFGVIPSLLEVTSIEGRLRMDRAPA